MSNKQKVIVLPEPGLASGFHVPLHLDDVFSEDESGVKECFEDAGRNRGSSFEIVVDKNRKNPMIFCRSSQLVSSRYMGRSLHLS